MESKFYLVNKTRRVVHSGYIENFYYTQYEKVKKAWRAGLLSQDEIHRTPESYVKKLENTALVVEVYPNFKNRQNFDSSQGFWRLRREGDKPVNQYLAKLLVLIKKHFD